MDAEKAPIVIKDAAVLEDGKNSEKKIESHTNSIMSEKEKCEELKKSTIPASASAISDTTPPSQLSSPQKTTTTTLNDNAAATTTVSLTKTLTNESSKKDDLLEKLEEIKDVSTNASIELKVSDEDEDENETEEEFFRKIDAEIHSKEDNILSNLKSSSSSSVTNKDTLEKELNDEKKLLDGVIINKTVLVVDDNDVTDKATGKTDATENSIDLTTKSKDFTKKSNDEVVSSTGKSEKLKISPIKQKIEVSKEKARPADNLNNEIPCKKIKNDDKKIDTASVEPMMIDSNENSNEKMDAETIEEKIPMDVDENSAKDEEMKVTEASNNIATIVHEIKENASNIHQHKNEIHIHESPKKPTQIEVNISLSINAEKKSDEVISSSTEKIGQIKNVFINNVTSAPAEQKPKEADSVASQNKKETQPLSEEEGVEKDLSKNSQAKKTVETKPHDDKHQVLVAENKLLSKLNQTSGVGSLTNSPISQSSNQVFNSTPIAKQFEIPSENVSKISGTLDSTQGDHNTADISAFITTSKLQSSETTKPEISDVMDTSRNEASVGTSSTSKVQPSDSAKPSNVSEASGLVSSTTATTTTTTTESGSYSTSSETEQQSSDEITKYVNSIKNGIIDSTTDAEQETGPSTSSAVKSSLKTDKKDVESQKSEITTTDSKTVAIATTSSATPTPVTKAKLSETESYLSNVYEINMWSDKVDIKYMSIERLDSSSKLATTIDKTGASTSDSSIQGSSNGSVSSLPPFSLPARSLSSSTAGAAIAASLSSSSGSDFGDVGAKIPATTPAADEKLSTTIKTKHVVQGIPELCSFMISHFKDIKKSLKIDGKSESEDSDDGEVTVSGRGRKRKADTGTSRSKEAVTPSSRKRGARSQTPGGISDSSSPVSKEGRSSKMSCESPVASKSGRSRKRSIGKILTDDEEDDGKPKAKQAKKSSQSKETSQEKNPLAELNIVVLAKWIDKKYYAGTILEMKPNNKFLVAFEDGATKLLPREFIVFGTDGVLPLQDQKVHVVVDDDDEYETGVVTGVEKKDDFKKTLYTVKAETSTVKVKASKIYLTDDQAKVIQQQQSTLDIKTLIPGLDDEHAQQEDSSTRSSRHKRLTGSGPGTPGAAAGSPEPGTSGANKKGGKRKRSSIMPRLSESSDITDTSIKLSQGDDEDIELVEGVQQEYPRTMQEAEDQKMIYIYEYKNIIPDINVDQLLGALPTNKNLFKNKCFLLTCTAGLKPHLYSEKDTLDNPRRNMQFSAIPYIKPYLERQIEEGGGKIYHHFKDVPKTKYRQCTLIAPRPCCTAKYIQCLAANIQATSHEWIIDSCEKNVLTKKNDYLLPAGWSILLNKFIQWKKGKADDQRFSNQPFNDTFILLASLQESFLTLWSRICKLAGGTIRYVKTVEDITSSTVGYLIADSDLPDIIRRKSEHFGIPIVSTVWIVQSLIMGKICPPESHVKLSCTYSEDDEL